MYVAAFGDKRGVFKCENLKKANVPSRLGSDGSLYEVEYTVALIPILLLAPEEESIYGLRRPFARAIKSPAPGRASVTWRVAGWCLRGWARWRSWEGPLAGLWPAWGEAWRLRALPPDPARSRD